MTLDDAPDVLTVPEAARLARVGRNAMYQAIARREIYSVRIGRSVRIPTIALRRFLGVDQPGEVQLPIDPSGLPPAPRAIARRTHQMTSSGSAHRDDAPRPGPDRAGPRPALFARTSSGARGAGPGDP